MKSSFQPKRLKQAFAVLCLLALFPIALAAFRKGKEFSYVDNEHIQTYEGRTGNWKQTWNEADSKMEAGKAGSVWADVLKINNIQSDRDFYNVQMFYPFSAAKLEQMKKQFPRLKLYSKKDEFIWPVAGHYLTSRHGKRWGGYHSGLDIASPNNSYVVAARSGKVTFSADNGALGNMITIEHAPGLTSTYAHNNKLMVKEGQHVAKGQLIALSGTTGRSTGPHLHFEVSYLNVSLNPEDFLPPFVVNGQANLVFVVPSGEGSESRH